MESALQAGIAAKLQYLARCLAGTNIGPTRRVYGTPRSHYTREAVLLRVGGPASKGGEEAETVGHDVQQQRMRRGGPLSGADLAQVDELTIGMSCEVKISCLCRAAPFAFCAD